jgi:transposase
MQITTVGLDLAKNVFQVHGVNEQGQVVVRKALKRNHVIPFFLSLPPCVIGMEACGSAHHWARKLQALGHTVRLMAPQFVKPYVKTNKHDAADAEAICEAVSRPSMRLVAVKTPEQQAVLSLHRARQGFVKAKTATANQIRGLLAEFGITLPQGIAHLSMTAERMAEEALPDSFHRLIEHLLTHYRQLDTRIIELERELHTWHQGSEASQRRAAIPGVGLLTATAVAASVGDARQFENARQMAAFLGLVPRQHASGGRSTLLAISKRGDVYLRTLMIQGARSVLHHAAARPQTKPLWHVQVMRRRNRNVAAVALANNNARTMWAILTKDQTYDPLHRTAIAA